MIFARSSEAQDEPAGDADDADLPLAAGRLFKGEMRQLSRRLLQHSYELLEVFSGGRTLERFRFLQCQHLSRRADHQFRLEWKAALDFFAKHCCSRGSPHDKRARGADIHDAKLRQIFCKFAGPKRLMPAYVHRPEKHN